jgi:hypothetical protein
MALPGAFGGYDVLVYIWFFGLVFPQVFAFTAVGLGASLGWVLGRLDGGDRA